MRARQSLRYRLPLLITTLLCVVVGALGWSAYRQLEAVLLQAANTRLSDVTQQLATMIDESMQRTGRDLAKVGDDPAFARLLESSTDSSRGAAQAALDRFREQDRMRSLSGSTPSMSLALWSRAGVQLLTSGPATKMMAHAPTHTSASAASGASIGALARIDSSAAYEAVAPITGANGDTLGSLVAYRVLSGTGRQITELIGSDGTFMIGSPETGVWTNLMRRVDGPTTALESGVAVRDARPEIGTTLGMAEAMHATPWVVWVEIPVQSLLAPAHAFMSRLAIGAAALIVLGALGAWLLSLLITAPLAEVTQAAEDFARGDYSRRVGFTRDDEIGRLGRAFDSMASQVQTAAARLHANADALSAANTEMRESERRYRRLVEFTPDAIIVHRDRTILFCNPAAALLYGPASVDDMVGRSILDLVPRDDRAELDERAGRCQVDQEPLPFADRWMRRIDGVDIRVEAGSTPFILDSRPSVLTIVRDVSGRKRLEEQVRQAQKMEAVGQLAGGIAHDFNNVLMAIRSYSEFVLESFDASDPRRCDVNEIVRAAARAGALTRQLLAFSRQQMLQPRVLDLNTAVADLAPMLGRLIGADMKFETRLACSLGAVRADPGQVEQVLVNLVVNARDAMPGGGALTVETANVELGGPSDGHGIDAAPGRYVVLSVSDSGCGMDRETQARIFEPFFTTKPVGAGTGLGLATVYGIVKQSGGYVSVYSELARGTTIKVYLPRVDEVVDPAVAVIEAKPERQPGTGTVLLVEDDDAVRTVMRRILTKSGYVLLEATNGSDALATFEASEVPIDLVITDLVMPEMGGRALAAELHARRPDTRVLFVSGFTRDAATRRQVLDPSANFLEKPFMPDALRTAVESALTAPVHAIA